MYWTCYIHCMCNISKWTINRTSIISIHSYTFTCTLYGLPIFKYNYRRCSESSLDLLLGILYMYMLFCLQSCNNLDLHFDAIVNWILGPAQVQPTNAFGGFRGNYRKARFVKSYREICTSWNQEYFKTNTAIQWARWQYCVNHLFVLR